MKNIKGIASELNKLEREGRQATALIMNIDDYLDAALNDKSSSYYHRKEDEKIFILDVQVFPTFAIKQNELIIFSEKIEKAKDEAE
jgi:hypothetical protein